MAKVMWENAQCHVCDQFLQIQTSSKRLLNMHLNPPKSYHETFFYAFKSSEICIPPPPFFWWKISNILFIKPGWTVFTNVVARTVKPDQLMVWLLQELHPKKNQTLAKS